jgi:LPS sulfotransferase NodH
VASKALVRKTKNSESTAANTAAQRADPISSWGDPRLDYPYTVPLRRSYIVASSYRCGSTFLCTELWKTGVLGAPTEYVNNDRGFAAIPTGTESGRLMIRFGAATPQQYFFKLLERRTGRNGVFGMKAHFHHFEPALAWCPSMLEILAPVTFIYINRRDRVAQAVSMAKAMQTNAWMSFDPMTGKKVRYDADFIAQCMDEVEQQRLGWWRWFESSGVTPFVVNYEDMLADKDAVVRSIVELLEVQNDEPEWVELPAVEKQGDEINAEWMSRFGRDSKAVTAADTWEWKDN